MVILVLSVLSLTFFALLATPLFYRHLRPFGKFLYWICYPGLLGIYAWGLWGFYDGRNDLGFACVAFTFGISVCWMIFLVVHRGKKVKAHDSPRLDGKKQPFIPYNQRIFTVPGVPASDAYAYPGTQQAYFRRLLISSFPEYALLEQVSPTTMRQGPCPRTYAPITFLLVRNGQPKLAIMLGKRTEQENDAYRKTIRHLEKNRIPVQHYVDTFRNKASYVYSRVQDGLL